MEFCLERMLGNSDRQVANKAMRSPPQFDCLGLKWGSHHQGPQLGWRIPGANDLERARKQLSDVERNVVLKKLMSKSPTESRRGAGDDIWDGGRRKAEDLRI